MDIINFRGQQVKVLLVPLDSVNYNTVYHYSVQYNGEDKPLIIEPLKYNSSVILFSETPLLSTSTLNIILTAVEVEQIDSIVSIKHSKWLKFYDFTQCLISKGFVCNFMDLDNVKIKFDNIIESKTMYTFYRERMIDNGNYDILIKYRIHVIIINNEYIQISVEENQNNVCLNDIFNTVKLEDITTTFNDFIDTFITLITTSFDFNQTSILAETLFNLNYRPSLQVEKYLVDIIDKMKYDNIHLPPNHTFTNLSINIESFNTPDNFYKLTDEIIYYVSGETYNKLETGVVIDTKGRFIVFEFTTDYIRIRTTDIRDIIKISSLINKHK